MKMNSSLFPKCLGGLFVWTGRAVEFCNIVCKQAERHVNLEEVNLRAAVFVRGENYQVVLGEMVSQPQSLDRLPSVFHPFQKGIGSGSASAMFPSDEYFEDQQQKPYCRPFVKNGFNRPGLQEDMHAGASVPSSDASTSTAVSIDEDQQGGPLKTHMRLNVSLFVQGVFHC